MEVIITNSSEEASQIAAKIIARQITEKPNSILGLATGSTPLALYNELIKMHKEENLDFSKVTTFNLDEYVGLSPEHHASYNFFMKENLFKHINVPEDNINIPDGLVEDIPAYCEYYEKKIKDAGGIDIQILGIGTDGHIGFNEPTSSFSSRTRIKTLTEETRKDNARFFNSIEEVPHHVITMGVGTVMDTKRCILLAFGKNKAKAIADTVEGPVTSMVPATALQYHQHAHIIIDNDAASELTKSSYYKWVYSHKPSWQQYK